jgi:hypothetical protein
MLSLTTRPIIVDASANRGYASDTNTEEYVPIMTVQSSYVVQMTCYNEIPSPVGSSVAVPRDLSGVAKWNAYIGNQTYASGALVAVENGSFNSSADWADVDPSIGKICFKVSLNVHALLADISGTKYKDYAMQVWAVDTDTDLPFIVLSSTVRIYNVVVEV